MLLPLLLLLLHDAANYTYDPNQPLGNDDLAGMR